MSTDVRTYAPEDVARHRSYLVAALRSDRYAQGQGRLRTSYGYCCLGVAEDVRGCAWRRQFSFWVVSRPTGGESSSYLTPEATAYYGLVTNDPYVLLACGEVQTLAVLNDRRVPFDVIADAVDAQPASWNGSRAECADRGRKQRESEE